MYTKYIQSGTLVELYTYEKEPITQRGYIQKRRPQRRGGINTRTRANSARSRKAFQRLVRANCVGDVFPALVTLTMFEIVRIDTAYDAFNEFVRKLRRRFGKEFKYIVVPEFQKRGAVHFHALVWGLPYDIISNESRLRYLQALWGEGFLDCIVTDGSSKLAGYLSKYMSKAMSDQRLFSQKAYVSSRNVLRSVSINSSLPLYYSKELLGVDSVDNLELLYAGEFDTVWLGRCDYKKYQLK